MEAKSNDAPSIKKRSPTNAAVVKDGLRPNLSATEATAQLKVLCRKFAALTEKVKEESKVRAEAEREVRRLNAIVDGTNAPVVASARTEAQTYMRELEDALARTKHELRFENDKNAMLVTKALELEREKSALLGAQAAASAPDSVPSRQMQWDKEQVQKIQSTLRLTIDELQDELTRKEGELESYRERLQRDRSRIKHLETELRARDDAAHDAASAHHDLETELQSAMLDATRAHEHSERLGTQLADARTECSTLETQLETLNAVNAALEQRCDALLRRVELSASMLEDGHDLTRQLRDAEIDNETLVRTIRDLKDEHAAREQALRADVDAARDAKRRVETQLEEVVADAAALRAQNALFSEWLLVRNANANALAATTTEHYDLADASSSSLQQRPTHHQHHHQQQHQQLSGRAGLERSGTPVQSVRRCAHNAGLYVHTSSRAPVTPTTTTHNMTPASPVKQQAWRAPALAHDLHGVDACAAPASARSASNPRSSSTSRAKSSSRQPESFSPLPRRPHLRASTAPAPAPVSASHSHARKMSTASMASSCASSSTASSSTTADHERLRLLMARNHELQQRLQHETLATQTLEQEITDMTSSYAAATQQATRARHRSHC